MAQVRLQRKKIALTTLPKIHSCSQFFRYSQSIFCLPHRPNFSDIFDLCLHWVSVVRGYIFSTSEQAISEFEVVEAEWRQRWKMMRRYFLLDLTLDIKHAKFYGVRPNDSWSHIFINVDIHKRRQNFFGHFWYPLPHVRILTLVYLTSTF